MNPIRLIKNFVNMGLCVEIRVCRENFTIDINGDNFDEAIEKVEEMLEEGKPIIIIPYRCQP